MEIIHNYNEILLLNKIYEAKDKNIILSLKPDHELSKIISIGFVIDETFFIVDKILDQKNFISNLFKILIGKQCFVILYDLKEFYSVMINNDFTPDISLFKDIKLFLYDRFNKHIDLTDETIQKFVNTKCPDEHMKFYTRLFNFDFFSYQVLSSSNLSSLIKYELEVLLKIYQIMKLDFKDKKFIKLLHNASMYYAIIEEFAKIKIDTDELEMLDINLVSKYFSDLKEAQYHGKIKYHLDHTSTGRLASSFHNIPEKYSKIIISRFHDGMLCGIDFQCFEFKILLKFFDVYCEFSDPYQAITDKINLLHYKGGFTRKQVKTNIIKWMYGSSKYDIDIINATVEEFNIKEKLETFKNNAVKNLSITTKNGFKITYKTETEAKRKCMNNMIQNLASFTSIQYTNAITHYLYFNNKFSKLIATIYDEMIIDIHPDEKNVLTEIVKFLDLSTTINYGKNLAELKK